MDLDRNLLNNNFIFVMNFSSENGNSNAFMWQNSKKFGLNKYPAKIEISTAHVSIRIPGIGGSLLLVVLSRLQLATCLTFIRTLLRFCVTTVRIVILNCLNRKKNLWRNRIFHAIHVCRI